MVATSLPFWMQQVSRTMLPFAADAPARGEHGAAPPHRTTGMPTGPILVETCPAAAIEMHLEAWTSLAARALEANVFMDPGFALPASVHFPPAERPLFVLCWDQAAIDRPVLIGLLALQMRSHLLQPDIATAWTHPQWVTSAPMLDRDRGAVALEAILGWLAARRQTRGGLLVTGVQRGGALARLLEDGGRRRTATLATRSRAVIDNARGPAAVAVNVKRDKEMRRQWRRLGVAEVRSARSVDDVRVATELFLELEARGWKGARRTALLADAALATFTRTMTRLLAMQGLCRIDTLSSNGQPIAMGVVLRSGDRAFFWKTAYDERFRRLSPGKQLARVMEVASRRDTTLRLTDSCALPHHPMIDTVWPDRIEVLDLLVACPGEDAVQFASAVTRLRLAGLARAAAKSAYHGLRRALGPRAALHG